MRKKFRILQVFYENKYYYLVEEKHWIMFASYWDRGAWSLFPDFLFKSKRDAERAILDLTTIYEESRHNG